MGTFSATANSSSTIGYAQYGSSSWSTGSSSGAWQGAYQGTTAAKSRVGVMVLSGVGAALKGKLIQSITLTITDSLITYAGNNKVAGVVNSKLDKLTPKFSTISGVSCITFTAEHISPYVFFVDTNNLTV